MNGLKLTKVSLLLLALGISAGATAGAPTTWILHNETNQSVTLSCQGQTNNVQIQPKFDKVVIPARQDLKYSWGETWYNDGLGLNPALWNCTAQHGAKRRNQQATSLRTDWGEPLELLMTEVKGQGLTVQKKVETSPAAKNKSSPEKKVQ